ncbi:MAG: PadR family transcriptional regulator [Actinomycetales bacterium]|nr:PadR family transcriptional regulator [Actinomycetales bacterium]
MQEAVLALLAKEPTHGYELQLRLQEALGPSAPALNAGQVYVALGRLERAGLVAVVEAATDAGPGRKTYELTAAGHERVRSWLESVSRPRPTLAEFHLKACLAARTGLADPVDLVDRHRREVLRRLRDVQRLRLADDGEQTASSLLLDGLTLQLDAELRWLDACARHWERATARGED